MINQGLIEVAGRSDPQMIFDWDGSAPVHFRDTVWEEVDRGDGGLHYQISWQHPYDDSNTAGVDPRGVGLLASAKHDLVLHATNDVWKLNETECADTQSVFTIMNPMIFNVRLDVQNDKTAQPNWGPLTVLRLTNTFKYAAICEDTGAAASNNNANITI